MSVATVAGRFVSRYQTASVRPLASQTRLTTSRNVSGGPADNQPQRQRRSWHTLVDQRTAAAAMPPGRSVQHHLRLSDVLNGPLTPVADLPAAPQRQLPCYLGQGLFLALPAHLAAVFGSDQEVPAGGLPVAVRRQRVGFAVDDMHQRAAQVLVGDGRHGRQHLVAAARILLGAGWRVL